MLNKDEILEKFQNGEQRYQDDKTFAEVVDSLAGGLGVYAVLDSAVKQLSIRGRMYDIASRDAYTLKEENQRLKDEVASLTDALKHYQK